MGRHWKKRATKSATVSRKATPAETSKELPEVGMAPLSEAAKLLNVCEKTMLNKTKAGEYPGRKIAGRWKFPWVWVRKMTTVEAG